MNNTEAIEDRQSCATQSMEVAAVNGHAAHHQFNGKSKGIPPDLPDAEYRAPPPITRTFGEFMALVDAAPVYSRNRQVTWQQDRDGAPTANSVSSPSLGAATPAGPATAPPIGGDAQTIIERQICKTIGLDILGEKPDGSIKIFNEHHRKSVTIPSIRQLDYQRLLQLGGPPIKEHVHQKKDEAVEDMFSFAEVKDAVALLAGYNVIDQYAEIGAGCWAGWRENKTDDNTVVVVGRGEAAVWDGQSLNKVDHPRCGGRLLELSGNPDWFDFGKLADHLKLCDSQWAHSVILQSDELFHRWAWKHQEVAPSIVTGLILASYVQTLWGWRPRVEITGKTKSGKSTLFKCLDRIFGPLALLVENTTAAGLRQKVGNSAVCILLDEFEKGERDHGRARQEIIEMFRASGSGGTTLRGTVSHQSQSFTMQHIGWMAAISTPPGRERDTNRIISLELLQPPDDQRGKLELPSEDECRALGLKLLAVAIKSVQAARPMAHRLRSKHHPEIDSRIVESYALPAAMLAAALREEDEMADNLLGCFLENVDVDGAPETDEHRIINGILTAELRLEVEPDKGQTTTIGAVLLDSNAEYRHRGTVEAKGVGIVRGRGRKGQSRDADTEYVFFATEVVAKLLKGGEWEGEGIERILRRIPDAAKTRRRLGGVRQWGVQVPRKYIEENHVDEEESG